MEFKQMSLETHFWGQVTQKVLIKKGDTFLFLKYPEFDQKKRGHFDLPGGRLNVDEEPTEGLKREVREEIGVDVILHSILSTGVFTNSSDKPSFCIFSSASFVDPDAEIVFQAAEVSGALWCTKEEALKLPFFYNVQTEFIRDIFTRDDYQKYWNI